MGLNCTGSPEYDILINLLALPNVSGHLLRKPVTDMAEMEAELLRVIADLKTKKGRDGGRIPSRCWHQIHHPPALAARSCLFGRSVTPSANPMIWLIHRNSYGFSELFHSYLMKAFIEFFLGCAKTYITEEKYDSGSAAPSNSIRRVETRLRGQPRQYTIFRACLL